MVDMVCPYCDGKGVLVRPADMRAKRKKQRLELQAVAKKMGISVSHLSYLENGKRLWNSELLRKFGKALRDLS